ncbi:MAG TPA: hypothetical protein VD865_17410, partial [Stenotrophomonas sp.]|nr:hypothetical protein [Stenotrophomonas sp.]
ALKGGKRWKGGVLQVTHGEGREFSGFSFHQGGRSELQFNVGFEDDRYFRYGVAFSLEPDRNLRDPVSVLAPKIRRFNASLNLFPALKALKMWRFERHMRMGEGPVRPIASTEIEAGNFIFVGERVAVPASGVTQGMLERAAQLMTSLLPVYEHVEGSAPAQVPYKVARLCWNTDFWHQPSGRLGKSANRDAFEAEHGFGHEEWLFDLSRLIRGYKYGFIQALNHSHEKYAGKPLNLLLYTIDNKTKSRYWVASIEGAQALTAEEARRVKKALQANGWLREMRQQVRAQGLDDSTLQDANPIELINLKYRPESLQLFASPIQFPAEDLPATYYGTLQDVPSGQVGVVDGSPQELEQLVERNINKLKAKRSAYFSSVEVDLVHKRWQAELKKSLKKVLPKASVLVEANVSGHAIDVVLEQAGKRIFVELKTRSIVRHAIREALAQLMEYSYWPPAESRMDAMLIVAAGMADARDNEYLQLLRERFGIPVHYRQYRDGSIEGISDFVEAIVNSAEPRAEAYTHRAIVNDLRSIG